LANATGQNDSKFGLSIDDAKVAIARLKASKKLRLDGLHLHLGSQIMSTEPFIQSLQAIASLGEFSVYDLGGGLGVRYTYKDNPPSIEEYLDALIGAARKYLPANAKIMIEPGRSMVADAAVTLYRVVTIKHSARTFVAIDGGMADNLEVSLYGQRFEATVATRVGGGELYSLVGRHCESGDILIDGVKLVDPKIGEIIAVPVTGAYCLTMANNYNGARRPPVVFCKDGVARPVVRRETYDDLLARDLT
jgi:diaminopimelate decarboxylase